jgi:hypothetical protein
VVATARFRCRGLSMSGTRKSPQHKKHTVVTCFRMWGIFKSGESGTLLSNLSASKPNCHLWSLCDNSLFGL